MTLLREGSFVERLDCRFTYYNEISEKQSSTEGIGVSAKRCKQWHCEITGDKNNSGDDCGLEIHKWEERCACAHAQNAHIL